MLYENLGRWDDAESLYREVLEIRRRVLGEDHADTLESEQDLARILKRGSDFIPTDQYAKRSIEGWTVYVNKELLTDSTALGSEALHVLETRLAEVAQVVPERSREELRRIPMWLGVDDGTGPGPEYHPSREWLEENGYNPDKAKSLEFGNVSHFLSLAGDEPRLLFIVLSFAYHDRVLGGDHEGINRAHQAALDRGDDEENAVKYFAYGTADFFSPDASVRDELRRSDPKLFELLEEVW